MAGKEPGTEGEPGSNRAAPARAPVLLKSLFDILLFLAVTVAIWVVSPYLCRAEGMDQVYVFVVFVFLAPFLVGVTFLIGFFYLSSMVHPWVGHSRKAMRLVYSVTSTLAMMLVAALFISLTLHSPEVADPPPFYHDPDLYLSLLFPLAGCAFTANGCLRLHRVKGPSWQVIERLAERFE